MAYDKTTKVTITADTSDLEAKLKGASSSTKTFCAGLKKSLQDHKQEWNTLGNTFALIGAAMVGVSALAVKRSADFAAAMSRVAATGDDAKAAMADLSAEALKMGRTTAYSATEAAAAETELLKAGQSVADVMGGSLAAALDMAAADGLDVAYSAELMATAMTQFRNEGVSAAQVADALAAGAGKAQGGIQDLGNGLKFVGPVAAQMNVALTETVGTLSMFATQGLVGEQAGTSLRGVLMSLTSPSAQAAKELDRLGITLYDQQGSFKGLANLAGQLGQAYQHMSAQERDASLGVIFGNAQITAARILYKQGAEGVAHWTEEVTDSGFAARQAATMMDNLQGDVKRLGGALDALLISGGSGLTGMFRGVVQGATGMVNAFSQVPGWLQQTAVGATGLFGALALVSGGFFKLAPKILESRNAVKVLAEQFPRLGTAMKVAGISAGALGAALGVATVAFAIWGAAQADAQARTEEFAQTMEVVEGIAVKTDKTLSMFNDHMSKDSLGMAGWAGSVTEVADRAGVSLGDMTRAFAGQEDAAARVTAALDAYAKTTNSVNGFTAEDQAGLLKTWLNDQAEAAGEAGRQMAAKALADKEAGIAADGAADSVDGMNTSMAQAADAAGDARKASQQLMDTLFGLANAALGVSNAQISFEESIDRATAAAKANGKTLDINTEKGRANRSALNGLAADTQKVVQAAIEKGQADGNMSKAMDTATKAMERGRAKYVEAAKSMGKSQVAAEKMADAVGLIPADVRTNVSMSGVASTEAEVGRLAAAVSGLPDTADVKILAPGARPSKEDVDNLMASVSGLPAETTAAIKTIAELAGVRRAKDAMASVQSKTVTLTVREKRNIGVATGGAIYGPGNATSDSVPAMLSTGEHVLTASDVSKMGGQGAVYRMRAMVQTGRLRFAGGGEVRQVDIPQQVTVPGLVAGGTPAPARPPVTNVTNVTVNNTYPTAEPTSVSANRVLQTVAAIGRG